MKIVFIPGLLLTEDVFKFQILSLKKEFNISIADTKGFKSITSIALSILNKEDGNFLPIGLSMGGYICMEIARIAPDRILGLGLLSTGATSDTKLKKLQREKLIDLSNIGKFKGVSSNMLKNFLSTKAYESEKILNLIKSMAIQVGKDNFVNHQIAIMNRIDQRNTLKNFSKPSLILCGKLDVLTPYYLSIQMFGLLKNCELRILPNIGHLSSLEAPNQVTEAIYSLIKNIREAS